MPKKRKVKKAKKTKKKSSKMVSKKSKGGKKKGFSNILKSGLVGKLVLGVGAATVVGLAVDRFAPQFGGIARPLAAFAAGGPVGAIGSLLISGGLGNIFGGFGGQQNGGDAV